jgi:hypothetical protein
MNEEIYAFPYQYKSSPEELTICFGMTLRDYFAAKALQGMCANSNDDHNPYEMEYEEYAMIIAKSAYQLADAMLEARQ